MLEKQVKFRTMETEDIPRVQALKKRSFQTLEGLFQSTVHEGFVMEIQDKLVAVFDYKFLDQEKKEVYVNTVCVDPHFAGEGHGKYLYKASIDTLIAQGAERFCALVKDDNVASYYLFQDNGFVRSSIPEVINKMGIGFLGKSLAKTPFLFANGMDFYVKDINQELEAKHEDARQLLSFIIINLFLTVPVVCIRLLQNKNYWLPILSYTIFLIFLVLPRFLLYAYFKIQKKPERTILQNRFFRLNNGGLLLTLLTSMLNGPFFLNANAYREAYPRDRREEKPYFIAELGRFSLLVIMLILGIILQHNVFIFLSELSALYLFFFALPVYPFEAMGGKRIMDYSKPVGIVLAILGVLSLLLRFFIF